MYKLNAGINKRQLGLGENSSSREQIFHKDLGLDLGESTMHGGAAAISSCVTEKEKYARKSGTVQAQGSGKQLKKRRQIRNQSLGWGSSTLSREDITMSKALGPTPISSCRWELHDWRNSAAGVLLSPYLVSHLNFCFLSPPTKSRGHPKQWIHSTSTELQE